MCKYVVVDLEMCRVPKKCTQYGKKRETIQIGAVLMDEKYQIIDRFNTYVAPEYGRVDEYIYHLTGITNRDLEGAPLFKDALTSFLNWIPEEEVRVVSWSNADELQIRNEAIAKKVYPQKFEQYRATWMDCQQMFGERMNTNRAFSLEDALFAGNIIPEGTLHNGLSDAYNTALLFEKINTEKDFTVNPYFQASKSNETTHLSVSLGSLFNNMGIQTEYCFA